ncbi:MAG: FAD-dependent oxidoreductase [Firmicutes bacterium]|nr:FAD-dependent oxidoreductase [Bacillota bacterium]
MTVVVLGAGPTGLSSAFKLASLKKDVYLIEKESFTGGICASFEHSGCILDLGPHRFTPHTKEIYEFVKSLAGVNLLLIKQKLKVRLKGKFLPYPISPKDIILSLSPLVSAGYILSFLGSAIAPGKKEIKTYRDWVIKRFGKNIYDDIFKPIAMKTWGMDPGDIDSLLAEQRISMPGVKDIILGMIKGKNKSDFQEGTYYPAGCFYYPETGIGNITSSIERSIRQDGGKTHTLTNATGINLHPEKRAVESINIEKSGSRETLKTDFLISTIPLPVLIKLINPAPPDEVIKASKELKYRSLILLYIIARKSFVSNCIGHYFPEKEFYLSRISEQKNFSEKTVPSEKSVICIELSCQKDDERWNQSDESLFKKAIKDLEKSGLLLESEVESFFSRRIAHTYPLYPVGFQKNLMTVLDYLKGIENLITNGRLGLFKYNNLHHSLEMGLMAADHVLSGKPKEENWEKMTKIFDAYKMIE